MPIIDNTRLLGAFFHWLGKVNTFDGNYAGNERFKSSHNVRSSEVWMDDIPYAPNFASASNFSDLYPGIIRKVGTVSSADGNGINLSGAPGYLYPLHNTVYQSWFLDTGTPSLMPGGQFVPSNEWVKPLINSTDVPNAAGQPSDGYTVKLYKPNVSGTFNIISYDNAGYEIDYFSGIFRFQAGKTPIDPASNSGLSGYQMSQAGFEAAASSGQLAALAYIRGNTGGIRAIAYQYVGQTLNTFTGGTTGSTGSMGATGATGAAGSNGTSGTSGYTGDKYRTQTTDSISISPANTLLSFTVSNSLSYTQNQIVIISYDGSNYMYGTVSGYNATTGSMSVIVSDLAGSGSYSDWTVNLFGAAGGDGSSGTSGTSGTSGKDGTSGTSGNDGTSGTSGKDGTSGTSGTEGTSGTSGTEGTSGTSGTTGTSGTSGTEGTSGTSGTTGTSGTSGYAGDKYRYVYGTAIDITSVSVNSTYTYTVGTDLAYSAAQSVIISYDSTNYIRGTVSSYSGGVISVQVSEKQGTANSTGFVFNLDGAAGGNGSSGTSGTSGKDGSSGTSGTEGTSGTSGTSGIGIPAGGTASWILAKKTNTDYDTEWVENIGGGGGSPLTVEDYLTGATYGNINNIIFRGNTVLVPGGTATGVLVTDDEPVTPGSIIVWIPAPTYAPYFSPSLSTGNQNRYVMKPTTNALSGSNPGEYSIGDWDIAANFNADTTRSVRTTSGAAYLAFSNATSFSCNTNTTSLEFTVYKGDTTTIAASMSATINASTTVTDGPLSITITDFAADNDRFKAKASGTINLATLFPYGGRFSWKIRHVNPGAPGSPLTFNSQQIFYDIDLAFDSDSSADISGTAAFEEKTPALKYYSGVAHYGIGSSFGFTVSGIDNLNDITIPASKQADISINNMAISGPLNGYADGTKSFGTAITGWTYSWNISGLTFSRTGTVDQTSQYIPGFASTANNLLNSSIFSSIDARLYDDGQADIQSSDLKSMLFDTYTPDTVTYLNNPVDSENGRLSFSGLSNVAGKGAHPSAGIHSGSATFSSLISLNTATDELQYIFGRIIYPQENFTTYRPLINSGASVNYFQNSGSASATFNVYTYAGLWSNTGANTPVSIPGFRWYVTSYTKDSGMTQQIFSGLFTFASNFVESDMAEGYNGTGYILNPQPPLTIMVGIDSTGANANPDKFLYVSGPNTTYGARVDQSIYNFNSSTKQIRWSLGSWGNSVNVRKVWLFVGFSIYSSRGKNVWLSDVTISYPVG